MQTINAVQRPARPLWLIVAAAGAIVGIAMGLRQVMGLFMTPMTMELGIGREPFSLAMATANLVWGFAALPLGAISDRYETQKRARALLDFDDLVARMIGLLRDQAQGPWVRYKLDGGLSHILVDESQDTNPEQWQVIDALAEEFFEPGGIERDRTLFAVGDGKQSIYSFQGAEPALFQESGVKYEWKAMGAKQAFQRVRL